MAGPKTYVIPPPPAKTGTKMTYAQLRALWIEAGGNPDLASTMAAVALAESGGKVGNLNNDPKTQDYSAGLWQINYYGNLLGPRTKAFGSPQKLLSDPLANAKAAVAIAGSDGSGIESNWTTFADGAYKAYFQPETPQEKAADAAANAQAKASSPQYVAATTDLSVVKSEALASAKVQAHVTDPWITVLKNAKGVVTGFGTSTGEIPPANVFQIAGQPVTKSTFDTSWSQYNNDFQAYTGKVATPAQQAAIISQGISVYQLRQQLAALPTFTTSPIYKASGAGIAATVQQALGKPPPAGFVKTAIAQGWDTDTLNDNIKKLPGYMQGPEYKANSAAITAQYEQIYGNIPAQPKGASGIGSVNEWIHSAVMAGWDATTAATALRADPAYKYSPEYEGNALSFLSGMGLLVGARPTLAPVNPAGIKNPNDLGVEPFAPSINAPTAPQPGPLPIPQQTPPPPTPAVKPVQPQAAV